MSHALYETTEPYYPDRAHGPLDFNEYLMPGPGDICPHDIVVLERPAPTGRTAPRAGRDERQSRAPGDRQRDLRRGRRAHRRSADHAGKGAARDQGPGRRAATGATLGLAMAVRSNIVGIDSPEALEKALRAADYLADEGLATAAFLALPLGKPLLLEGAPGVGKTEAAKGPRRRPRPRSDPPAMLRGHRRRGGALRVELSAPAARHPPGRRREHRHL